MAIGEKKAILRSIHESASAPAEASAAAAPGSMLAKSAESKSAERWFARAAHAAIYLLVLIGGLAIGLTLRADYVAGYALTPGFDATVYIRDFLRVAAVAVFLILLGIGIMILFRETLPKRAKWVGFALLVALLPLDFFSIFFYSAAYNAGRNAGLGQVDLSQLQVDADALQSLYSDNKAHTIGAGDPDFAKVPSYLTDKLKAYSIEIDSDGVAIINGAGHGDFDEATEEGFFVPARTLTSAEAEHYAANHNMKILGGSRPVMHFDNRVVPPVMPAP